MLQALGTNFSCQHCGKSYKWKPSIGGKKAKCACGAMMLVPKAPPEFESPDLNLVQPVAAAVATIAGVPAARKSLQYGRRDTAERFANDKLYDAMRDLYVPLGLLIAGFLGMILWALLTQGTSLRMSVIVLMASAVSTSLKTLVLVGLGFWLASRVGVGFGTFWSALLKFGAIIILTDVLLLWMEAWMISNGAIRVRGGMMQISIWILVIEATAATAVIAMLLTYLFDMDRDETTMVAAPIAVASMIVGFILKIVLLVTLRAIVAARTPAPPPPAAAPAAAGIAATQQVAESARDKSIRLLLAQSHPQALYPYEALGNRGAGGQFSISISEAGVTRCYKVRENPYPNSTLYIQLPETEAGRAACFAAYAVYCRDAHVDPDPIETTERGQKWMVIPFNRSKAR